MFKITLSPVDARINKVLLFLVVFETKHNYSYKAA